MLFILTGGLFNISSKCPSSTWHHRLSHLFTKVFNTLSSFLNVSPSTSSFTPPCNYCQINKSHKLPFYNSTLTSNAPLDLIFLMFGLLLFYLMIILNIASFLLYPIKYKSDSLKVFFSDFNLSLKNTLIDQLNKFSVIMVMNMLN